MLSVAHHLCFSAAAAAVAGCAVCVQATACHWCGAVGHWHLPAGPDTLQTGDGPTGTNKGARGGGKGVGGASFVHVRMGGGGKGGCDPLQAGDRPTGECKGGGGKGCVWTHARVCICCVTRVSAGLGRQIASSAATDGLLSVQ